MIFIDQVDLLILIISIYNALTLFGIQQTISSITIMGYATCIGTYLASITAIAITLYNDRMINNRDAKKARVEQVAKRQQAVSELKGCLMLISTISSKYNQDLIHNFGMSKRLILEQHYYQLVNNVDRTVAMVNVSQTWVNSEAGIAASSVNNIQLALGDAFYKLWTAIGTIGYAFPHSEELHNLYNNINIKASNWLLYTGKISEDHRTRMKKMDSDWEELANKGAEKTEIEQKYHDCLSKMRDWNKETSDEAGKQCKELSDSITAYIEYTEAHVNDSN